MIPPWAYLDEHDRAAYRTALVFLRGRLADVGIIDWAARLKHTQLVERIAISEILNSRDGYALEEPWASAWRLIEESWSADTNEDGPSTEIYGIQNRLRAGDRSGAIVSAIVQLVAPRLKIEPIASRPGQLIKRPRRPKTFSEVLSTSLTSGELVDLNVLELARLSQVPFLVTLANALESAVSHGLDIARRIGWDGKRQLWRLGFLNRVDYTQAGRRAAGQGDADAYNRGIAPSTKLLNAVVSRIAELDASAASPIVHRWRFEDTQIHVRLWAAIAQNPQLATAGEVGQFLLGLDDRQFWDLHAFPEIAELRAIRYGGLDPETRKAIVKRIRKGPPRDFWPKKADPELVKNARTGWAAREFKRIEVAGSVLPPHIRSWVRSKSKLFPDLAEMAIDAGFPQASEAHIVPPNPDERYDALVGVSRLRALEIALSSGRGGWDEDPAKRANDWLQLPGKTNLVLNDLESVGRGGDEFPRVWDRFGWAHSPRPPENERAPGRDLQNEADGVLRLLGRLSEKSLLDAIEGISNWLDAWRKYVIASPLGLAVWLRVWPIAVEATNVARATDDDADLSVSARAADSEKEPLDLDTLNTPAGKLVGVFLSGCPSLANEPNPFGVGSAARQMRDAVIGAPGRSGLIARHRLIEALPYFLHADASWARLHLIDPLLADTPASLALWRAIARQTHFTDVLRIIGNAMAERAMDRRLGRQTRSALVFSLIVESMHAFREKRDPAVPNPRVQQMLRSLDDEVRAAAANAIQRFVHDLSKGENSDENRASAADLFRSAAEPFVRQVWPQERSLATPGVSSALSDLPATSGDAFAEAVDAIERFLVPFDCWSMLDYGLYGDDDGARKLAIIDDEAKARAFLRLLNATVGTSEESVIPHDLTDALDQIHAVAPSLVQSPAFRRLSTAARR